MVDVYIDTQPAGGEVRKSEKHGKKNLMLDNFFVLTSRLKGKKGKNVNILTITRSK